MAGISNTFKSTAKTKQFFYDVFFDGALLSSTRGSLIVELIKYFLYERQQIPQPVDELKNKVAHEENYPDNTNSKTDHLTGRKSHELGVKSNSTNIHKSGAHFDVPLTDVTNVGISRDSSNSNDHDGKENQKVGTLDSCFKTKLTLSKAHPQDKKAKQILSELTQLFDSLQKAFELCPEIEQVAIILGGTVMNPKESYIISFPPPCPDADSISLMSCRRTLFQQIIGQDILGTMSANITPTSMMILVLAPRSCPVKGFVPKHFMRTPKTGAVISFNFRCNYLLPVCHDLTFAEEFEMSGIEILGSVQKNCDSQKSKSRLSVDSKTSARSLKKVCEDSGFSGVDVTSGGEQFLHPGAGVANETDLKQTPQIKLFTKIRASPVVRITGVPERSAPCLTGSDCIWYQSPIVIKGYRIKDVFHNAFTSC